MDPGAQLAGGTQVPCRWTPIAPCEMFPPIRRGRRRSRAPIFVTMIETAAAPGWRAGVRRGTPPALPTSACVLLATTAGLLGGVELALVYSVQIAPPWPVALFPATGWLYAAIGLLAWSRRPSNRLGALMFAAGIAWMMAGIANAPVPVLTAAGLILGTLPLALVVHLLHAFPSGRVRGRVGGAAVIGAYVVALPLQAPSYLFGVNPDGTASPLAVAARPNLATAGEWVQRVAGALVMVATAVVLAQRLRESTTAQRRVLAPLFVYGSLAVTWVWVSGDVPVLFPFGRVDRAAAQIVALAVIPVAFVTVLLRGGFARTGALEELGARLTAFELAQPALAQALGDPSIELLFWATDSGRYVDSFGRPATLPEGRERAFAEVTLRGHRVGAIVYDATLLADPELVVAVGRVAALALDRERTAADLHASQERLRRSRAAVVDSADRERRRIARDLHDGLQAELVLLAVQAHLLATADDPAAAAGRLEIGLRTAIAELRELVHGVVPGVLAEQGLYVAAQELAHRMPIPVRLELDEPPARLPAPVESAGYFVISEALGNAVKHSRANELGLGIRRADGCLRIEIVDDGVGGATIDGGSGLCGIGERIEALDGRLTVESPPGGGTRLVTELPCAS